VTIDAASDVQVIHPEIYGVAFADTATLQALHIPLHRWGGDGTTLYNWQLDSSNHAADWYFENLPNGGTGTVGTAGYVSSADAFVTSSKAGGAGVLMTIPTIGWTAKDSASCGFPTAKYGQPSSVQEYDGGKYDVTDANVDPYNGSCGGDKSGNQNADLSWPLITGTPTNDAVAVTPSFEAQWLAHLTQTFGTANSGGIGYYQLDNEMNLWSATHADVRTTPVASADVWNATANYAPVIRTADPNAFILGYTSWGVLDLFYSDAETVGQTDAHDSIPLAQWYLRQLAAYQQAHGTRLVDCLDIHYYAYESNLLESPRALWDPTFDDTSSWVPGSIGGAIDLIPRVKQWIATEYPGTGVCFSEYNFNFPDSSVTEAGLIEADVLGIYGKNGVRLAAYWTTPVDTNDAPMPPYRAFQIYRNYDGAGGHFGDYSVATAVAAAKATALANVSFYAASDASTGAQTLTVVIINKDTSSHATSFGLQNFSAGANAHVYQTDGTTAPNKLADVAVSGGQISLTLPKSSITLLVIPHS
jgi:hypothetical protein